jgi:opacity protein-like surface antigen
MNKYQRIALGIGCWLCIVTTAYADWHSNWLVGASTGYAQRRGPLDINVLYLSPLIVPSLSTFVEDEITNPGVTWGLFAGYQVRCNSWLMGAELNVDVENFHHHRQFVFADIFNAFSWDVDGHYKRGATIGLTGRIGYAMAPYFIAYMRAGAETSKDKLHVRVKGAPNVFPFIIPMDETRWVYRYLVGAGAETPIFCTPISLRLEYNFHSRGRALASSGFVPSFPDPMFNTLMHPTENSLKLALVWNFV